ncbi:hypothetical protein [Streptomyces sp. NPDC006879]|uniref:hypothetical protein n=1 Tax=Streptomyces sp. NPDC006879 TaxID=3364767 RepID=UPI0036B9A13B
MFVLTAVLLTPARFPGVLGDDYPQACATVGVQPRPGGYGLVLGQDSGGARWTVVVDDVSLVAVAIASWDCGMDYDLSPDERSIVISRAGWPLALTVAASGVPHPHDPEPGADGSDLPALSPPDNSAWGAAQRRLGADEIALQWATWRARFAGPDEEHPTEEPKIEDGPVEAGSLPGPQAPSHPEAPEQGEGTTQGVVSEESSTYSSWFGTSPMSAQRSQPKQAPSAAPGPRPTAEDPPAPSGGGHAGVRKALADAEAYLQTPPPIGRIRSAFASGDARTLRVDGPGWSLVARTDDIAFVLLDEEPATVIPVRRGASLPALLTALDGIAIRPS